MKWGLQTAAIILGGLLLSLPVRAGTITKNYTFSSGATASSSQVNSNFDQLVTEMNSKEARLTTVESAVPVTEAFFMDEITTTAGTLTTFIDAGQQYGFYCTNGAGGANGDGFQKHIFIKAGSYTLYVMGIEFTNRGKLDWYLDGTLVASGQDWYSAGLAYNITQSAAISVTGNGDHILKAVVNGHNASSGGFAYVITKIWIK